MLRGLTTVTYTAADVAAAAAWYTEIFGVEPYYVHEVEGAPAYMEFRIGDYQHEFGILNRRFVPGAQSGKPGAAVTYWAVDDLEASFAQLLSLGATEHLPPTEHGPGFVTASVVDPFGNVLGIMYNQHYLDILESRGRS